MGGVFFFFSPPPPPPPQLDRAGRRLDAGDAALGELKKASAALEVGLTERGDDVLSWSGTSSAASRASTPCSEPPRTRSNARTVWRHA